MRLKLVPMSLGRASGGQLFVDGLLHEAPGFDDLYILPSSLIQQCLTFLGRDFVTRFIFVVVADNSRK